MVQGLLAAAFLFAGGLKLVLPLEAMAGPVSLPGFLLRFVGAAEVLGAVGLILPGLLRIRPGLTPLAATGLTVIMVGAVAISATQGVAMAAIPFVTGALTVWVARARWVWLTDRPVAA
jgi:hypothetical protein